MSVYGIGDNLSYNYSFKLRIVQDCSQKAWSAEMGSWHKDIWMSCYEFKLKNG